MPVLFDMDNPEDSFHSWSGKDMQVLSARTLVPGFAWASKGIHVSHLCQRAWNAARGPGTGGWGGRVSKANHCQPFHCLLRCIPRVAGNYELAIWKSVPHGSRTTRRICTSVLAGWVWTGGCEWWCLCVCVCVLGAGWMGAWMNGAGILGGVSSAMHWSNCGTTTLASAFAPLTSLVSARNSSRLAHGLFGWRLTRNIKWSVKWSVISVISDNW
jgi:hypothetical protein